MCRDDRDENDAEKEDAERLSRGRGRVPKWEAGSGWKPKFTEYVSASRDVLSSYFLCSNDSNRMLVRRKLIIGLGMRGNLALENGTLCEVRLSCSLRRK